MIRYRFEWEKGNDKGKFDSVALTEEECILAGQEEIEENGAELVDYYTV